MRAVYHSNRLETPDLAVILPHFVKKSKILKIKMQKLSHLLFTTLQKQEYTLIFRGLIRKTITGLGIADNLEARLLSQMQGLDKITF